MQNVGVLVVGGGPTGLTAALLLARAGVTVTLVERRPGTSVHPRARGLNVRTMEIFRALGIDTAIRDAGAALAASKYMLFVESLAGTEIRRVPDDDLMLTGDRLAEYTPCQWSQCAQDDLEPLLLATAQRDGANVLFDTELTDIEQNETMVTATLRDRISNETRQVQAHYLIVADGASSPTRAMLGINVRELGVMGQFVNIYFQADLRDLIIGREFGLCFVENPAAQGMFLPVNNADRWLFNAEYTPPTTPADFTAERCLEILHTAIGRPETAIEIMSALAWDAAARIADTFHSGRVFLAGDAAHTMPPAGGFGMNTGIQDAHNLAWKLAAVLNQHAAPALLDSYAAERQPVAETVVARAAREMQARTPDTLIDGEWGQDSGEWHGEGGEEGGGGEWEMDATQIEAAMQQQLAAVIGYRYHSAAIIGADAETDDTLDLRGQPGTRLPHFRLDDGRSSLDLCDGRWLLLTNDSDWTMAAQRMSAPVVATYVLGDATVRCGISAAGAVLVRPDGFVGWRSIGAAENAPQTLAHTFQQLLGRNITSV